MLVFHRNRRFWPRNELKNNLRWWCSPSGNISIQIGRNVTILTADTLAVAPGQQKVCPVGCDCLAVGKSSTMAEKQVIHSGRGVESDLP